MIVMSDLTDKDDNVEYVFSFEGIIKTKRSMFEAEDWAQYIEKVIDRSGNIIPETMIVVRHVSVMTEDELKSIRESQEYKPESESEPETQVGE